MDPKLRSLILAADRGEPCPPVHLLTASAAVSGIPAPHGRFGEALREPVSEELWASYASLPQSAAEKLYNERLAGLRPTWQAMAERTGDDPPTLTLADAEVWPLGGGDGVALPALRVPLGAITCWWSGTGTRLKAPRETSWGFGVIVPLDEG